MQERNKFLFESKLSYDYFSLISTSQNVRIRKNGIINSLIIFKKTKKGGQNNNNEKVLSLYNSEYELWGNKFKCGSKNGKE